MRKLLVLIIFSFASFISGSKAQGLYRDSVKDFLNYWLTNNNWDSDYIHNTGLVFDNPVFLYSHLDSFFMRHFQFDKATVIYKLDYKTSTNDYHFHNKIDSIILTKNEMNNIVNKMRHPVVAVWTNELLPSKVIVTQKTLESLSANYYYASKKFRDVLDKHKNDDYALEKDPLYKEYKQMMDSSAHKNNYLKVCNPIFLRNGKYVAMYFHQFAPTMYIYFHFAIYKNENGHWQYFGSIYQGNLN